MENCKKILFRQIDGLDCDIILPMGLHSTQIVLDKKIDKLSNYVGKEFVVNFGSKEKLVVPIYHTSPANPQGYKGNKEIFKKINEIISKTPVKSV